MPNMSSHSGRGLVKHPERDGRLRENRGIVRATDMNRENIVRGGQGRVKDPSRDGRLKQNRRTH
jgi:hypothetical protein